MTKLLENQRLIFAYNRHYAIMIWTDSECVQHDAEAMTVNLEDIGIDDWNEFVTEPGLYLWIGNIHIHTHSGPDDDYDVCYTTKQVIKSDIEDVKKLFTELSTRP